ncbi:MAG: DNA repair protein RecN [Elusimicrobiales bacterium]|nr:DNA repair protein RecN [Elusimicrobiales bacterium]
MLVRLETKNFAIIDRLSLEFGEGLAVFTGETGAGKSILIEALGFALGDRAVADSIRPGAQKLEVSAEFTASSLDKPLRARFSITGKTFQIRRELDVRGKSRAFINGRPVTVAELSAAGEGLVDFHGQHEHQTLVKNSAQLALLDRFGATQELADKTGAAYRERQAVTAKLEASRMSREEKERLLDLYKYQSEEIEKAAPRPGEDAEIEAVLPRLKNSDKLRTLAERAHELLYSGEGAAVERLGGAAKAAAELAALDSSLSRPAELIAQALAAAEEAAGEISALKDDDASPERLDELISRQEKLSVLKKKYGATLEAVLERAQSLKSKIADLETSDEREEELKKSAEKLGRELSALCEKLHDARSAAAKKLSAAVLKEIKPLGLGEVRFLVSVEMDEAAPGPDGADAVEFLFSPNPGQPLRPLKNIASGGEMSRVMLGVKTALAAADRVETLVFDEVDAGVGGTVGRLVGEKLARIAKTRQVLCVTHLPQVAAWAGRHFVVSKTSTATATTAAARLAQDAERDTEIARMLGGGKQASETSLRHARELIEECAA